MKPDNEDSYWIAAMWYGYNAKFTSPIEWQSTSTGEVLYGEIGDHKVQIILHRIEVCAHIGRIVCIRVWDGNTYAAPPTLRPDQQALISGSCFNALRYTIDEFDWQFYITITGNHQYGLQGTINYDIEDQMRWAQIKRHLPIKFNECEYILYTRPEIRFEPSEKQMIVEKASDEG